MIEKATVLALLPHMTANINNAFFPDPASGEIACYSVFETPILPN
jgi:hypothetical protein